MTVWRFGSVLSVAPRMSCLFNVPVFVTSITSITTTTVHVCSCPGFNRGAATHITTTTTTTTLSPALPPAPHTGREHVNVLVCCLSPADLPASRSGGQPLDVFFLVCVPTERIYFHRHMPVTSFPCVSRTVERVFSDRSGRHGRRI